MIPAYARPTFMVRPAPTYLRILLAPVPASLVRKGLREARALVRRIERKRRRAC